MGDTGLEHNAESPEKHALRPEGGTESGAVSTSASAALDLELTEIIAGWSRLPTAVKMAIVTFVRLAR
jgi:hypothetical protein